MKATKLLLAAAFAGLASLSFAGPGPEYWARVNAANKQPAYPSIWQNKTPAQNTVKAKPAAKPATEVTATCATCGCSAKKV
jgi:hypothetical protein